jgi:hypothetical protein
MGYVEDDIAQLRAEVERLGNNELDCKSLRAQNKKLKGSRDEWEAAAKHYVAENERLRDALEWISRAALQSKGE